MVRLIKKLFEFLFAVLGAPYHIFIKLVQWLVIGIQGIIDIVKKIIKYIVSIFKFIFKWIIKGIKYIPALLKKLGIWFVKAIKESIAQIFTLLGFFIAWLTLTGSAKDIVGIAIIVSTALWLVTISLREDS
tara:strand:- start:619 stop:1011 length:393 start_codon:yes stop_codon:yes gene_type:complete